jgi:hypothetical protein
MAPAPKTQYFGEAGPLAGWFGIGFIGGRLSLDVQIE